MILFYMNFNWIPPKKDTLESLKGHEMHMTHKEKASGWGPKNCPESPKLA